MEGFAFREDIFIYGVHMCVQIYFIHMCVHVETSGQPCYSSGDTFFGLCLRVSVAVKRPRDHSNSYKGKHLIEVAAYHSRGLVHYHHGREHDSRQHGSWEYGGVQADMV